MMAYTKEARSATRKPERWTPGASWATTRKVTTCRTSTRTATRISETGAASVRMTGRMTALNSDIRMTATTPSMTRSTWNREPKMAAVARNETVATIRVIRSRFRSATRPPRHSHSTRSCVS